jgi:hypothetical protein
VSGAKGNPWKKPLLNSGFFTKSRYFAGVSRAAGAVASTSLWLAFIGSATPSVKLADLSNAGAAFS